jgi:hypothetical protein
VSGSFEPIEGFSGEDEHPFGGRRVVRFDSADQLLEVHVSAADDKYDVTTTHYRLVPVRRQWVEIGEDE